MSLAAWLLLLSALLAAAVLLGVLARRVRLPLTVVLAVVGFLVGWLGTRVWSLESPLHGEEFEEVLVFVFLPVLVFEAAFGLSTRAFMRNLGSILVLAVPALIVSAAIVGLSLYFGLGTPLVPALLFGSLISATDPVAVVSIFRELGVPRRLLTLVEGESLLNDGVAIVLFTILLAAAVGGDLSVRDGLWDFVTVFFGGAAIGAAVGLLAALALPWLDPLAAAALSLAVAYGGFVLADDVLGFSGVTATVAAGLVLGGSAPIRASAPVRTLWEGLWEALGYVANALLFLLIGLAIDPSLLADNAAAIGLAVVAVLLARTVAVLPLVALLERIAGIPPVGIRNEAVLIWGGLRGGVALALALALPEELPQREQFVAMTGGVVLATLLLNATTIGPLVRRLGLNQPSAAERFLAAGARLSAIAAARQQLADLGLEDPVIMSELDVAESSSREELIQLPLSDADEVQVVTRRGLVVERETYQRLSDAGLLPPVTTRALLHEVDDQIEALGVGRVSLADVYQRDQPVFDRVIARVTTWLPSPIGDDPRELAYAEASARRLAAQRTTEALELFTRLPNIAPATVQNAKATFATWSEQAVTTLAELDAGESEEMQQIRHRQAETLMQVASTDALQELAEIGLLPEALTRIAAGSISADDSAKTSS